MNVLFVDDGAIKIWGLNHALNVELLTQVSILKARNCSEAIFEIETTKIDLIIMDLSLDQCDGFSLLNFLSVLERKLPVIICSKLDGNVLRAVKALCFMLNINLIGVHEKKFMLDKVFFLLKAIKFEMLKKDIDTEQARNDLSTDVITDCSIEEAFKSKYFVNYYQPKICLNSGVVCGLETIVSINHPDIGIIESCCFLDSLTAGQLYELTFIVLENALNDLAEFRKNGFTLSLSVSISVKLLKNSCFSTALVSMINKHNVGYDSIILELTSIPKEEDLLSALEFTTRMRMLGAGVSLAKFKISDITPKYLSFFPLSEMKVDKSYISNMMQLNTKIKEVVKDFVRMGTMLGIPVAAEGVEDVNTLCFLKEIGCSQIHGGYMSPPLSFSSTMEYLHAWS